MANILTDAFRDVERHLLGESHQLHAAFQAQLNQLQTSVVSLAALQERFEHLTTMVTEQRAMSASVQAQHEQLAANVASLQQAHSRHEGELASIHGQVQAASTSVNTQIEGIVSRLSATEGELGGLKTALSEFSPRMATVLERLDSQDESIRSLTAGASQRAEALDQILAGLSRLKTATEVTVARIEAAAPTEVRPAAVVEIQPESTPELKPETEAKPAEAAAPAAPESKVVPMASGFVGSRVAAARS